MRLLLLNLLLAIPCLSQGNVYIAVLGGIATLSGDTRTPAAGPVGVAFYEPRIGAAWNLAAGFHINDWFSVQANYIGNRNRLGWTYFGDNLRTLLPYQTAQHAAVADLLLYFRDRQNWVRPYLSAGLGVAHTRSELLVPEHQQPETSNNLLLRSAVGVDLRLTQNLRFRYSFSESISGNPFAGPVPSKKSFMNFQNLFGVALYF